MSALEIKFTSVTAVKVRLGISPKGQNCAQYRHISRAESSSKSVSDHGFIINAYRSSSSSHLLLLLDARAQSPPISFTAFAMNKPLLLLLLPAFKKKCSFAESSSLQHHEGGATLRTPGLRQRVRSKRCRMKEKETYYRTYLACGRECPRSASIRFTSDA